MLCVVRESSERDTDRRRRRAPDAVRPVVAVDMRLDPVDVSIVQACPRTARTLSSRQFKRTCVSYAITEADSRVLSVGRESKHSIEYPVAGGVKVFARFVHEGKATLLLVRRNISLLLSGADPPALTAWLAALANGGRPPAGPVKRALAPSSPSSANAAPAAVDRVKKLCDVPSPTPPAATPELRLSPASAGRLTEEQQGVLKQVLAGRSVFFTGGAGTGKSFLLQEMVRRLPGEGKTHVTASTGVAACVIGGVTVHHWAGIGGSLEGRSLEELVSIASRKRGKQWRAARTLIIDEVSMLDGAWLDVLDQLGRRLRHCPDKAFGGLQLVLVGDFFQLPPVRAQAHAPEGFASLVRAPRPLPSRPRCARTRR